MKSVCIYCGASEGNLPEYAASAVLCGEAIAKLGLTLVFGGGNVGLMGIVADAALAAKGKVIGVIPQSLVDRELAHRGVTELIIVQSMHERKQRMADLAEGFIALPGGIGTLEETVEALTWLQLAFHNKPVGVLNINNYYDPLVEMLEHMDRAGFLHRDHRSMLLVDDDMDRLLARMNAFKRPQDDQWSLRRTQS